MLYVQAALLVSSYVIILKFNQLSALMDSLYRRQMHDNEREMFFPKDNSITHMINFTANCNYIIRHLIFQIYLILKFPSLCTSNQRNLIQFLLFMQT